ncbi:MAG TPA: hypothetical protein VEK15_27465 [Vicinamibacteria bacterium]|nr:hypothetical protein [Vicinamibacteria bacterium]
MRLILKWKRAQFIGSGMDASERQRIFEQALGDYREGRFRLATSELGRLVDQGSKDPAHLSYYGLLRAITHRDESSVALCQEAVHKNGRRSSVLYLNLARALTACGRRGEAVETVRRGLLLHSNDRRLRRELQHLVPRAKPTFPSLGRAHALNRYLGIARTVSGRLWAVTWTRQNT